MRRSASRNSATFIGGSPSVRTALSPRPTPSTARPSKSWPSVASMLATTVGCRVTGLETSVPTRMRVVDMAAAVR